MTLPAIPVPDDGDAVFVGEEVCARQREKDSVTKETGRKYLFMVTGETLQEGLSFKKIIKANV